MRGALVALLLVLASTAPACAQNASQSFYTAGKYEAAADAGEQEGGAAGYLMAARALLALCVNDFRGPNTAAWLDRAQRDAEAALADAPNSVTARLQLATALGMKGRRASVKQAMSAGYARRGRALIDQALKLSPQDPWAHALLGGWNLEVVRRGGVLGSTFMGASTRAGVRAFDQARAIAPNDATIALHYALALLSLDPAQYADKASALLTAAANAAPQDAFETCVRDTARRLAGVLASKGPLAAAATAEAAYL